MGVHVYDGIVMRYNADGAMNMRRSIRNIGLYVGLLLNLSLTGCSDRGTQKPMTNPAKEPQVVQSPASSPAPVTSQSESSITITSAPDLPALPPSTYESKPPYPVEIHVRTPKDEQPGWLKITALADTKSPAGVKGSFPEQNLMIVETQNVARLEIHAGHLPLAARKRVVLRIDKQGIQLIGDNTIVVMTRRPTGAWEREKPTKD